MDLFSGAGGLTCGFAAAGFEPILAVEKEPDFADTYALNFGPHVVSRDIESLLAGGLGDVAADVVIGGPPCQGFSNLAGNRPEDPRRALWAYFMDVVEATKCKVFLVENVPNLLTSPEGQAIMARARALGFQVTAESAAVLLASRYGVPQNRRRAFILGSRLGPIELPKATEDRMTVRDAFKGIPLEPLHSELPRSPAIGADLHVGRNPTSKSVQRYRCVPPGGNRFDLERKARHLTPRCWLKKRSGGTDLFGRLEWDGPARCTIRTEFYKPEKGRYLHPQAHRPITHWEAARLQTFPDTFKWSGTKIRIAIQIGNAVPPKLAEAVAREIHAHLRAHNLRPSARVTRKSATAHDTHHAPART
ncbi:MAG: DNA cytosine methyltransferase [Candidatus Limnocylindrus sp.]